MFDTPSEIYKLVAERADRLIGSRDERQNLDIVIDIHWFFLHSMSHKQREQWKRHAGKWKYRAHSREDLIEKACRLLPAVASGRLPVVKFTNVANVFTGEMLIVAYCFASGPGAEETKKTLLETIRGEIYWGSNKYKEP